MKTRGKHAAVAPKRGRRAAPSTPRQRAAAVATVQRAATSASTTGRRAAAPATSDRRAASASTPALDMALNLTPSQSPARNGIFHTLRKTGTVLLASCSITMIAATPASSGETFPTTERESTVVEVAAKAAPETITAGEQDNPLQLNRANVTSKHVEPEPEPEPEEKATGTSSVGGGSGDVAETDGSVVEVEEAEPVVEDVWVKPVPSNYSVSSHFGHRGAIPAAGTSAGLHNGIDFGAPFGTSIFAASGGIVVHTGFTDFDTHTGGIIVVHHVTPHGEYLSSYNHMETSGILVDVGDTVEAGDVIGKVASTGMSTGPHLHFTMREVTGENILEDWELLEPIAFFAEQGVTL